VAEWRVIPGFPSYEASDEGVIRPVTPRYKNGRGKDGLRPWTVERHGRIAQYVTLHVDGKRHKHLVSRLVCTAFHGAPPEGMNDCCHKDHNSLNNRASNLKWDTHANNVAENFSEEAMERRARWEDDIGLGPCYTGPDRYSDVPF
jgi:hypothetical protein